MPHIVGRNISYQKEYKIGIDQSDRSSKPLSLSIISVGGKTYTIQGESDRFAWGEVFYVYTLKSDRKFTVTERCFSLCALFMSWIFDPLWVHMKLTVK